MKFANFKIRLMLTLVAFAAVFFVSAALRGATSASPGIMLDRGEEASEPEPTNPYAEWRVFLVGTNDYSGALPDMRFAENDVTWHTGRLTDELYQEAIREIND